MKHFNSKTIFTTLFLGIMLFANAQENARTAGKTKGKISNPGPKMPSITAALAYGNTMPSSTTKDGAYVTNTSAVSADVSIPFASFRKGWDGTIKGKSYLSLNIGGQYNFGGSGNPTTLLPSGFAITGQTSNSVAYRGVDPKNPGFRIGAGPQANFNIGKFTISPMVLAEYFSMTQKELSAVQTTQYNGQTLQYNLFTLPETKTSGFAITPKVRIHYMFTQSFGLFVDGSYILGPKVQTQLTTLVPQGNPQTPENTYEQQQLDNGTYVKGETKSTSYSALGVNVGLSFAFGKPRKGWNGVTEGTKKDDIQKGWNGVTDKKIIDPTLLQNIQVSANDGVENLAKEITKSGKSKASVVMDNGKKVLKVVTQDGEYFNSDFFTFNNNPTGPSNIISGGYTSSCRAYQCQVGCDLINGLCSPCSVGSDEKKCTQINHNEWNGVSHDYLQIIEGLIPVTGTGTTNLPDKGWDGTIKGLFDIKSENISVAKNGGIEKLIENINKGGKAVANKKTFKGKDFLMIVEQQNGEQVTNLYPVDNSNPSFMTIGGGSGSSLCKNGGCRDCGIRPSTGICDCLTTSTTSDPNHPNLDCIVHLANPIGTYTASSQIKNLALTLEPDGTTLTTVSVKNIKDLMLQSFPKTTFEKAEIIKENKDKFVKVQLNDNGTPITLLNMIYNPGGPGWILIGCSGTCYGSLYGCESKNINIVGACGCAGDNHCFGINHLFHGINSTISIEK